MLVWETDTEAAIRIQVTTAAVEGRKEQWEEEGWLQHLGGRGGCCRELEGTDGNWPVFPEECWLLQERLSSASKPHHFVLNKEEFILGEEMGGLTSVT